jgi:hypothetical protein
MAMRVRTSKIVTVGVSVAIIAGTQGCGGFTSYRHLNKDLKTSTGQDVHVVIQKIGYPTGQAVVAGDKVYAWEDNGCTIHVAVDATEHIQRFDFSGSHHDCERISDRLDE